MRISGSDVPSAVERNLANAWLVVADEPLLAIEAGDAIRKAALGAGYSDREVVFIDQKNDWGKLTGVGQNGSLFSTRQLLEWRVAAEVGKPGSDAIKSWFEHFPPDTLVLMMMSGREVLRRKTKWVDQFESNGVVVDVKPVYANQFPRWLQQRLNQRGLRIDPDALDRLCYRLEGNLLASAQEVERLALWCEGHVTLADVEETVGDSARFDLFQLTDRALSGDAAGMLRVIRGLQAEGEPPQRMVWLLHREIHHLRALCGVGRGQIQAYGRSQRLWPARLDMLSRAANRFKRQSLDQLLVSCQQLDAMSKGRLVGDVWESAEQMLLVLAGRIAPDTLNSRLANGGGL